MGGTFDENGSCVVGLGERRRMDSVNSPDRLVRIVPLLGEGKGCHRLRFANGRCGDWLHYNGLLLDIAIVNTCSDNLSLRCTLAICTS